MKSLAHGRLRTHPALLCESKVCLHEVVYSCFEPDMPVQSKRVGGTD